MMKSIAQLATQNMIRILTVSVLPQNIIFVTISINKRARRYIDRICFYFGNTFHNLGDNQNITNEGDHGHSAVPYDKSDNLGSEDGDDAMEQLILAQGIKVKSVRFARVGKVRLAFDASLTLCIECLNYRSNFHVVLIAYA